MQVTNTYVGRFAPSPTGPLHFGSLVAALASFLDARHHNGRWLIRIEDIDPPREIASAPQEIFSQLRYFGLVWDGDPMFQSTRIPEYEKCLAALKASGLVFSCTCSRKSYDQIYPGNCRNGPSSSGPRAERIRVDDRVIQFDDLFVGAQRTELATEVGDFIVKRKDGLFAYQLAVVVDDQAQGITHVIRGHDLLDSTPRQIYLAEQLSFHVPHYGHFPVVLGEDGHKLSKQAKAEAVAREDPTTVLNQALLALGQMPVKTNQLSQLLDQAIDNWDRGRVPRLTGISQSMLLL